MWKSCSRCGKIHDTRYKCYVGVVYQGGRERELRNTYAWQEKSKQIRQDANYLCEVCRHQGMFTYKGLEVHHIDKLTDRPDLLLDDSNLICLCVEHHKAADKGDLSKEFLRELVEKRLSGHS